MSRLTLYLLFTIGLLPITSHAQKHIQGTVKDADNNAPLPEASILVEGTQVGTLANQNGTFTLDLWQLPAVLRVSHIGYRPQRKIISEESDTTWAISLQPKALMLDEIVVTAHHSYLKQLTTEGGWDGVWSPNGKQIAFTKVQNKNADIWIHTTDTGKATQFTNHPAWDASPAWSPDGLSLAFTSYRTDSLNVWIKNITTQNLQQVTVDSDQVADDINYGARHQGSPVKWTPDGKSITFSKKDGIGWEKRYRRSLWQKAISDTNSAKIISMPGQWLTYNAVWTPDQSQMAFSASKGIHITHPTKKKKPKHIAEGQMPTYSPDGQWLAYSQHNKNNIQDLWIQNVQTGKKFQLTNTPTKEENAPHWSPNGQHLLFAMREAGHDLWTFKLDEQKPVRLAGGIAAADWSPDGESIGFVAHTDQGLALFKMHSSGGHWTPLSKPNEIPTSVGGISWSPDGKTIIGAHYNYLRDHDKPWKGKLWQYDLATPERTQIIHSDDLLPKVGASFWQHSTPTYSPDGQWITFTMVFGGHLWSNIWRISSDGSIVERSRVPSTIDKNSEPELRRWSLHSQKDALGKIHPTWSFDGTQIAFTYSTVPHPDSVSTGKNAAKTIWITPADSDDPIFLTEGFWPAWSPDRQHILFLREETQKGEFRSLWKISVNGGELQKILSDISGITHIKWSPTGDRILFLTPPNDNLWVMQLSGTAFQPHLQNTNQE